MNGLHHAGRGAGAGPRYDEIEAEWRVAAVHWHSALHGNGWQCTQATDKDTSSRITLIKDTHLEKAVV